MTRPPFAAGLCAAMLTYLAGCVSHSDRAAELAAERERLFRTDMEFSDLSEHKGTREAFASYCAEDATLLPMNGYPVTGKDSIRAVMSDTGGATLTWKPAKADVAVSGDLGYTWGMYQARGRDNAGNAVARYGKYLTVWRKQQDGSWKFIIDIGNPGPAPSTAE